ncbi:hypothetical protein POV27_15245 [Aureisphaera galaxeae]|uniref:hypothetical protein n=1 Tax=Aureisphaera galaxeae TaxID=1538023 RepID=UPI00234FCA87|nr:hypothetical protein [Aureisphaera galaxeae]MDC8005418.1 hypothetical protein [Aureisphaera galaxeae]
MQANQLAHTKTDDLVSEFYHEWGSDMSDLLGTWDNVNPKTGQISRIIVTSENQQLKLQAFGKLNEGEMDWGTVVCEIFSSNVASPTVEGFMCRFNFDFMHVQIAGNMKYGVMVIQSYNTFTDGTSRNNYFSREFFCKLNA